MKVLQTNSTEEAQEMVPGFDPAAFARWLDVPEPELLRAARRAAFERYAALPLPHQRMEEWRRTDPALFPFKAMSPTARLAEIPAPPEGEWEGLFDGVVTLSGEGYAVRDVSGLLKERGVQILSLAEAAVRQPEIVKDLLGGTGRAEEPGKFSALNEAFWNVGFLLSIPAGVSLPKGILLDYAHPLPGTIFMPRVALVAGAKSRVSLTEHFHSPDADRFISLSSRMIRLEEEAAVQWISLQEWGAEACHLADDRAVLARAAKLEWVAFQLGARLSRMVLAADTAGEGAQAELDGLYFAVGRQHMDQRTLQIHSAPATYSRLLYKGAVRDESHSVYQGLIVARPGANRVDAYQKNNNLVLDKGARADSLPGLRIDTDDLKCSHGSTVGNLDEEQVFYLRARGLSDAQARQLLLKGFFEEIIARAPQEAIREHVRAQLDGKMSQQGGGV